MTPDNQAPATITQRSLYESVAAEIASLDLSQLFGEEVYERATDADQELMAKVQRDLAERVRHMRLRRTP